MNKFIYGLIAIVIICAPLFAIGQTALDPLQGGQYAAYPDYLDHSCGGVKLVVLEDAGTVAMVSARTTCPGSGRVSKPRNYLACWRVTFAADRYYIIDREKVFYVTWLFGQGTWNCPAL